MNIDADTIAALIDSVERIERAVIGDPSIGHFGLVAQLEHERNNRQEADRRIDGRHEQLSTRVGLVERWKDRAVWTAAGIGAGSAVGGGGIVYLITGLLG